MQNTSINSRLTKLKDTVSVSVLSHKRLADDKVSLALQVTASSGDKILEGLTTFEEQTNKVFQIIPKTATTLASDEFTTTLRCTARVNPCINIKENVPFNDAYTSKMKTIATNMYIDESEAIWEVKGDYLVKNSKVDTDARLDELLNQCCASANSQSSKYHSSLGYTESTAGQYSAFLVDDHVDYGYIVASANDNKVVVISSATKKAHIISNESLVLVADLQNEPDMPQDSILASSPNDENDLNSLDVVYSYYENLFNYAPDYYRKINGLFKNHLY